MLGWLAVVRVFCVDGCDICSVCCVGRSVGIVEIVGDCEGAPLGPVAVG